MYLVISFLVLMTSAMLFRRAGGSLSLTKLNMTTYTFYMLIGTMFLGATAVLYGVAITGDLEKLHDDSVIVIGWAAVMYAMIAVPCGMLLVQLLFARSSMRVMTERYRQRPIEPVFARGDRSLKTVLKWATLASLLALVYTFRQLDQIPLFEVFRGESDANLLGLQRALARLSQAESPLTSLLNSVIELQLGYVQVLVVAAFFYWRQSRSRADLRWFVVALVVTVLSLTYNISKMPLLMFIVNCMIVITASTTRVRLRAVVGTIAIGSALAVAMYVYYRNALVPGEIGVLQVWTSVVFGRVASGNLISLYYCLDIFPRLFPHIGFASTGRLLHQWFNLPYSPDYGLIVMSHFDPAGVDRGEAGHMTAVFLGEAWANFGWAGLLVAPLWVGAFIQACHLWLLTSRKSPLHLGLYGFVLSSFALATSGVIGFYYPAGLLQLGILSWSLVAAASILRMVTTRRRRSANPSAGTGHRSGIASDGTLSKGY